MKIKLNNSTLVFAKKRETILHDYSNAFLIDGKVVARSGKETDGGSSLAMLSFSSCEGGSILRLTNFCTPTEPTQSAVAFYSDADESSLISTVIRLIRGERGAELQDIAIPSGAKYIRCTYWAKSEIDSQNYPPFVCKVIR